MKASLPIVEVENSRENGLHRFRGRISAKDADELLAFVESAEFSKIDAEDIAAKV